MNRFLTTTAVALLLGIAPAFALEDSAKLPDQSGAKPEASQSANEPSSNLSGETPSVSKPNLPQATNQPAESNQSKLPEQGNLENQPGAMPSIAKQETLSAGVPISEYYSQTVYDDRDNKIGEVKDLLLEKNGAVHTAILGVGGFLGAGEKNVAVPFAELKLKEKNGQRYLVMNTSKEALESAPGYIYDRSANQWISASKQG
jgi:sporulation protein YlmC with PRC-barrel domain